MIKTIKNLAEKVKSVFLDPWFTKNSLTRLALLTYSQNFSFVSLSDDFHVAKVHPPPPLPAATLGKQVMSRTCAVRYSALSEWRTCKCGLVTWGIVCIFYLRSTLFFFFFHTTDHLGIWYVGTESSSKASRIIDLNISHKLLCCMASQESQVLQT